MTSKTASKSASGASETRLGSVLPLEGSKVADASISKVNYVGQDFVSNDCPNSGFRFRILKFVPVGYRTPLALRTTVEHFVVRIFRFDNNGERVLTTKTVPCSEFLLAHSEVKNI
jgi:hypothetical protein